jgi:hypothetical protein
MDGLGKKTLARASGSSSHASACGARGRAVWNREAVHFREYRLRVIAKRLEAMPQMIDRL